MAQSRAPQRAAHDRRDPRGSRRGPAHRRPLPRRAGRCRLRGLARWPPGGPDLAAPHPPRRPAGRPAGRDRGAAPGRVPSATELAVQAGDDVALVWEFLPGAPISRLTSTLLNHALALNNLQAGRLTGRDTIPAIRLYLTSDGPGYCLHQPLRELSTRTRRLDRWITTVGASHPDCLSGHDAVHCDYQPSNLLADRDHITGVVDWDGAGRGDRRLDLVTLRFGIHAITADPAATGRLDQLLDTFPPHVLAPMWAHMSLRMTDWAIRHFTPSDVDHWLDLAEQRAS